jgi:hypothetical protein
MTVDKLDLDKLGIKEGSLLHKLVLNLNTMTSGSENAPINVMNYGGICDHDSGYLCEHRLKYILEFIQTYFKER